jgi:drug/metabolite transporter (DMT)-like permease
MLAIPTTVIIDWIAYNEPMTTFKIVGTLIVVVGFLLVNVEWEEGLKNLKKRFKRCC